MLCTCWTARTKRIALVFCAFSLLGVGGPWVRTAVARDTSSKGAEKTPAEAVPIKALLERLRKGLLKKDARLYSSCFAASYLKKEFGVGAKREKRIEKFLKKMAASTCSFKEVRIAQSKKKPTNFEVRCYRRTMLKPFVPSKEPGKKGAIDVKLEYFEDSYVVDMTDLAKPLILDMKSKVSLERRKAVYGKRIEKNDKELAKLGPDRKGRRAFVLAQKAENLWVGFGDAKKAEACLREGVKLTGKSNLAGMALASLLQKTGRYKEALVYWRAAAVEVKDDKDLKPVIDGWIKECEDAIRKRAKDAKGKPKPTGG